METSDHGADIGQGSDTLFPSTAITFSICAVMMIKKRKRDEKCGRDFNSLALYYVNYDERYLILMMSIL